jgi:hypothetical protein
MFEKFQAYRCILKGWTACRYVFLSGIQNKKRAGAL